MPLLVAEREVRGVAGFCGKDEAFFERVWALNELPGCGGAPAAEQRRAEWDSCCYLCGDPLAGGYLVSDHDHRCCKRGSECEVCRRGGGLRPV